MLRFRLGPDWNVFSVLNCILRLWCCRCGREYQPINLSRIHQWIEDNRLDPTGVITMRHLLDSGAVHKNIRDGIKLLANVSALCAMMRCLCDVAYSAR